MPAIVTTSNVRNLVIVFGDQLNEDSDAFEDFDTVRDIVLMIESHEEATYVPQHKTRLVLFFSAMRHFRDQLKKRGYRIYYRAIDDPQNTGSFRTEMNRTLHMLQPSRVIAVEPGDYRVRSLLIEAAAHSNIPLDVRVDRSFLCNSDEFQSLASSSKKLIMESFYRFMRRKHHILVEHERPVGGKWNFDAQNRKPLPAKLHDRVAPLQLAGRDHLTEEVKHTVEQLFPNAPGSCANFDYPVTRAEALTALEDFVHNRLSFFGPYQDAMSLRHEYLFHSRLSSSLNLHLLMPREVIAAALKAYEHKHASLASVEGFVRQVLGWREFVHGIYWMHMPKYAEKNALDANLPVPKYLWTGETDMNCIRAAVNSLSEHAYTHHIQRLMVLGLHSLLLGVHPYRFHEWHISMFVDAIDWVSLPNALGMSQFGDGGIMGTKPYCASGNYINRLSDYCHSCRYRPEQATGPDACPFTTLYWDFLERHAGLFEHNLRMRYQLLNLRRREKRELVQIRRQADHLKQNIP